MEPDPIDPQRWLDLYGDSLFRYALFHVKDRDRAEDLVQEAFLAALKSQESFRGGSAERTWLFGILKHKIMDSFRKQYSQANIVTGDLEDDTFVTKLFDRFGHWTEAPGGWRNPHAAMKEKEFWSIYGRCLDALPAQMSDAFTLRTVDEIKSEEVCNVLGVSATNLRVILYRARLRLRSCLEKNWFATPESQRKR